MIWSISLGERNTSLTHVDPTGNHAMINRLAGLIPASLKQSLPYRAVRSAYLFRDTDTYRHLRERVRDGSKSALRTISPRTPRPGFTSVAAKTRSMAGSTPIIFPMTRPFSTSTRPPAFRFPMPASSSSSVSI